MAADVPAHIAHQPAYIQNGVKVQAGTNWDFSRGAVATPIVTLPDPEPIPAPKVEPLVLPFTQYVEGDEMPQNPPLVVISFGEDSAVPATTMRAELHQLDHSVKYIVAGHADASEGHSELLSRRRANAVAAQLRKLGYKVSAIKSFGERRALTADHAIPAPNRRVDVVAVD